MTSAIDFARGVNPYHPATTCKPSADDRRNAAYRFRQAKAKAVDCYHRSIAQTWQAYGRPTSSTECQKDMAGCWREFKRDIADASAMLRNVNAAYYGRG